MTKQVVTLQATEQLYDGSIKVGTTIVGITNQPPMKLLKFANLNDLSAYSVLTFPNDGQHNGSAQPAITYDATGGFAYVGFCYEDGSSNEHVVIDKIDITATPPTRTNLVDFQIGPAGLGLAQTAPALTNDGTSIWGITKPSNENARLFRVNIATPATRSEAQVTGVNHVRAHTIAYDAATSSLYFSGTKIASGKLAWVGKCALDLSGISTNDITTTKGLSDDITIIGTSFYLNHENEDVPQSMILKVLKADLTFTQFNLGFGQPLDGGYFDGVGLWVAANTNPTTLVQVNPATGAILQQWQMATGETAINEILAGPDANHLILWNYNGPPNIIYRMPLDGTGGNPVSPGMDAASQMRRKERIRKR